MVCALFSQALDSIHSIPDAAKMHPRVMAVLHTDRLRILSNLVNSLTKVEPRNYKAIRGYASLVSILPSFLFVRRPGGGRML